MISFTTTIDIETKDLQKILCWPMEITEITLNIEYILYDTTIDIVSCCVTSANGFPIHIEFQLYYGARVNLIGKSYDFIETLCYENEEKRQKAIEEDGQSDAYADKEYYNFYGKI